VIDTKLENAIQKLDDTFIKQKSIAKKLMKEHHRLQQALANMLVNADEDCPSHNRTEHFRSAMKDGYSLLRKIGYFEKEKND
jgi:hypothetical protein